MKRLSNTELAELILTKLYDLAEESGYDGFWNIKAIAKDLGEKDTQKIFNIAKLLQMQGYITAIFAMGGIVEGQISGAGGILVEKGGQTGIIKEYRENPKTFIINLSEINQSNISINSENINQSIQSKGLEKLVDDLKLKIADDEKISRDLKKDLLADAESLKLQLNKKEINKNIVKMIIANFSNIESAAEVLELINSHYG
jgi:hypothetical protein